MGLYRDTGASAPVFLLRELPRGRNFGAIHLAGIEITCETIDRHLHGIFKGAALCSQIIQIRKLKIWIDLIKQLRESCLDRRKKCCYYLVSEN